MAECDVLIVGGGMAGASLALALSRHAPELSVAVVENAPLDTGAAPETHYQPSYDARSTALAWGSRLIYEDLGLWPALARQATPIRRIHVSDRGRFGSTRLDASEHGQEALGYVIDNAWLGLNLVAALRQTSVQWLCPARVSRIMPQGEGAQVEVTHGEETAHWQCGLLVIADGGRSGLRESLGFRAEQHDYGQHALIATVTTARPHQGMAYERFSDDGPIALLPHGTDRDFALVWTLPEAEVAHWLEAPPQAFLKQLQSLFGWRQGRFEQVGRRQSYPLSLQQVPEPVRPGVALVGNAAHALHPVAGQGFNLALRGLMRLSQSLAEASGAGRPLGGLATLQPWLDEHRRDVETIVGFSDGMVRLFGREQGVSAGMRDLGLLAMDATPGIKHWFGRQTMGLGGRRSSLQND